MKKLLLLLIPALLTGCTISQNDATRDDSGRSVYVKCWNAKQLDIVVFEAEIHGGVGMAVMNDGTPFLVYNPNGDRSKREVIKLNDKICAVI